AVNRDSKGYIDEIVAPLQNLSAQHITGIDISSSYHLWKFKLAVEHSLLFHFEEEGFPGMGMRDKLDENGRPKWRDAASFTFNPNDRHDITLTALTTAGQQKMVADMGRLP